MREVSISFRVEPETARGLTWLTNKYNYENNAAKTKTDVVDALIREAIKSPELLVKVFNNDN